MKVSIGIDLGTSSMKFTVVSVDGAVLESVSRSIELHLPKEGYAEESLSDFRDALFTGLEMLAKKDYEVEAIAIDGQMHGLCLLDSSSKPLYPCILWNDSRSKDICSRLNENKEFLLSRTGDIAFPGFTLPKLLWVKENEKEVFSKISHILLPKDYLNFLLTGEYVTDPSDISGSLFYNIFKNEYDKDILEMVGLPGSVYPRIVPSKSLIGVVSPSLKERLGLKGSCRVYQGAGDNMAASYSMYKADDNACNISVGTSGTIYAESTHPIYPENGSIHLFRSIDGGYCSLACMLSCCSSLNWFLNGVLGTKDYDGEIGSIDEKTILENRCFFLPYLMGERSPINDPDARGMFYPISLDTTRKDMVLSVIEGICFALRDSFEVLKSMGYHIEKATLTGGAAKSKWFKTILSSILDIQLVCPFEEKGPSYGMALLGLVSSGLLKEKRKNELLSSDRETINPDPKLVLHYEKRYQEFKKLYPMIKSFRD